MDLIMKKKVFSLLLASALLIGCLAGCGDKNTPSGSKDPAPSGSGSSGQTVSLKLGHVGPPGSTMDIVAQGIAEQVKEATNGSVEIIVYPQGQLGDETVMLDSTLSGTLDMAMIGTPVMSTVFPEFNALCLPFLFRDTDEFFSIVQTDEFIEKTNAITSQKGAVLLGYPNGEQRGLSNVKHEVRTPADMAGLKIRVMNGSIYTDTFAALGATTSTMPFGEVYTALQQGVIDGEDNGLDFMTKQKFSEVEKYHTNLGHAIQTNPFIVNSGVWDKLSADQQQAIKDAIKTQQDAYAVTLATELEKAVTNAEDAKVNLVMELTDEEYGAFRDACSGVYEKYQSIIGDEFYNYVLGLVDAARK